MRARLLGLTLAAGLGLGLLLWFTGVAGQGLAWLRQQGATVASPSGTAVNKCMQGSSVTYTNGPCPPDSHQQLVQGGTLSVLPAPAQAAPLPARPPHARALLLEPEMPGQPSLKDQRMEAIIGR